MDLAIVLDTDLEKIKKLEQQILEYFKNNNCNRDVFCFDFNDLMEGKVVYSRFESSRFEAFKNALRLNRVEFENPAVYNQIIEIYSYL